MVEVLSDRKSEDGLVFVDMTGVDAGDNFDKSGDDSAELDGAFSVKW